MTPRQKAVKLDTEQRGTMTDAHNSFNKGLNSYASYKVNNRALGQDLVQDTFIKTWAYLVKKGKINGMRAFLYHVLNNLIVDEYRKQKYKAISLDSLLEDGYSPSIDDSARLFDIIDGRVVIPLILELPEVYQVVMRMRYIQDLTLKEIALLTGQSENTISVRVHRGIRRLRVLYDARQRVA